MTYNVQLNEEPADIWRMFAADIPEAERLDVQGDLADAERECAQDASEFLLPWLQVVDEALHCLLCLSKVALAHLLKLDDVRHGRAFLLFVSRSCTLTAAIRRLVVSGFEDAAATVARSLIETLSLALVAGTDREFAEIIDREPYDYDPNEFWKNHVGYSRLSTRLDRVYEAAGYTAEEREGLKRDRIYFMQKFAESLHSSMRSANSSFFVPSLRRAGYFRMNPLGHVSSDAPRLLFVTAEIIHETGVILCRLAERDRIPVLVDAPWDSKLASFFAAFLTLQEVIVQNEERLREFEAAWEEEYARVNKKSGLAEQNG